MGMTKQIKQLLIEVNLNQKELAEKLGVTQPVLSKKFKLDDWRESDLQEIAKVCGCDYISKFKLDNKEI